MNPDTICAATLRDLRLAAGLSVPELATRAGIAANVLYRIERGQTTRPYMRTVRVIAKALKVEPRDLLARTEAAA